MSVRSVLTRTWITQHTCFGTHEPDLTFFLSSLFLLLVPLLSSFLFLFPSFILHSSFHFISSGHAEFKKLVLYNVYKHDACDKHTSTLRKGSTERHITLTIKRPTLYSVGHV